MKKILAILTALVLIVAAAAALAEETPFTFRNGVTFIMDMPAVMGTEAGRPEIDTERTRGGIVFDEAEYENVTEGGVRADLEYLFIGNCLVAIRVKYDDGRMNYDALTADLRAKYGEPATADAAKLGKAIWAVDDDGFLKPGAGAFTAGNLTVIVERAYDDDGDEIEVTYLDMSAAYVTAP